MRISDWSSDVCSSDLQVVFPAPLGPSRPTASPRCKDRVTPRRTGSFLKLLPMLSTARPALSVTRRGPLSVAGASASLAEPFVLLVVLRVSLPRSHPTPHSPYLWRRSRPPRTLSSPP